MKKFLSICLLVLVGLASVNVVASEKSVFNDTVKEVDLGGSSLVFQNTTNLQSTVDLMLDAVTKAVMADISDDSSENTQKLLVLNLVKRLIVGSNYQKIVGFATSTKTVNENLIVYKSFINTQTKPKDVLYNFLGTENIDLTQNLKYVPEDAIFAAAFDFNLATLKSELEKDSMFSSIFQLCEMQFGIPFADIIDSTAGVMTMYVNLKSYNGKPNLDFYLQIKDSKGTLTTLCKTLLGVTNQNRVKIPVSDDLIESCSDIGVEPEIIFGNGNITIVSKSAVYSDSIKNAKGRNILTSNDLKPYTKNMSKKATGQLFVNLSQNRINMLNSVMTDEDDKEIMKEIPPCVMYSETVITDNGYKSLTNSSNVIGILK